MSPDGRTVAFVVADVDLEANSYRRRIWLAPSDGSEPSRPFTSGPSDRLARWSPDGSMLAFVTTAEEGPAHLCVLPVSRGGERLVVAILPDGPSELAWSPDGSELAFVARDPDPERYGRPGEEREAKDMPPRRITRLFFRLDSEGWVCDRPSRLMVVPADASAAPRRLTPGPFQAEGLAWSPDGSRIAFCSGRHASWDLDGAVDLWTVSPHDRDAEPERLTETVAAYSLPAWSPDGSRIAYLRWSTPFDEPRHQQVGVLEVGSGRRAELTTALDRNCAPYGAARPPIWVGERLLFSVEDGGSVQVYAVAAGGGAAPEPLVTGEQWVSSFDCSGGTVALAVSTPTTFPELVAMELPASGGATARPGTAEARPGTAEARPAAGGVSTLEAPVSTRRLTDLTRAFSSKVTLGAPESFLASSADGTDVPCWAIAPVGAGDGPWPTLLNVHGGPFTSYGYRFFDEFQMQSGAGFGVLYCNPRGSSGYSEAWGRAVRWPECATDPGSGWGGVDFEDVMACVEEACRRFAWVDPERIGIIGGSYGGYMTSWAIGHTDRFKAACSERACNNLLSLEHNSDFAGSFRGDVGVTHLEDAGAYLRQSPATYVREMTTPLLMLHSEDDLRCPVNQAEELFVSLRLLGREPELVRFPGESHELSRGGAPAHRVTRAEIILEWFRDRLGAAALMAALPTGPRDRLDTASGHSRV